MSTLVEFHLLTKTDLTTDPLLLTLGACAVGVITVVILCACLSTPTLAATYLVYTAQVIS